MRPRLLEPRPGCCDDRLYKSAEFFVGLYYVWGFLVLIALICLICSHAQNIYDYVVCACPLRYRWFVSK